MFNRRIRVLSGRPHPPRSPCISDPEPGALDACAIQTGGSATGIHNQGDQRGNSILVENDKIQWHPGTITYWRLMVQKPQGQVNRLDGAG